MDFDGQLHQASDILEGQKVRGLWRVTHKDPEGNIIDEEEYKNIVVNEGLNGLLASHLNGGTQQTSWYIGLIDANPTFAAGDTMGGHGGWTENQNYDEANRQSWNNGGVSGQSIDNSANPATYTMNTNGDSVGGAFLVADNTIGGTTGPLYAEGSFSTQKNPDSGDTLEVTATFTTSTV